MKTLPNYRRLRDSLWPAAHPPRSLDWALVARIRNEADGWRNRGDDDLAVAMMQLRSQVRQGGSPLAVNTVTACLALVCEAVRRVLALEYYDVQLLAGLALATGTVAEMKTGEGKTIVAALPAALHALTGRGVHVATVNSYLAARDCGSLKAAYEMLGFSVGLLLDQDPPPRKMGAYACDITYGTGYEFGFDYLRDQDRLRTGRKPLLGDTFRAQLRGIPQRAESTLQRGHAFAVIDEIDSVLIDEANTPLVLSNHSAQESLVTIPFERAAEIACVLREGDHYFIDRRRRTITITEAGQGLIFESQIVWSVEGLTRPWQTYVENALRAKLMLQRDVDYVVQEGEVRIVDTYTGRIFADRSWRDGLHQAVEHKEGLTITPEKRSVGRISRQRYFGRYQGLCGMTGTATGHEREFWNFYHLPLVVIPERRPSQRKTLPTRFFTDQLAKWRCIVDDIQQRNQRGQPVLLGTRTIDESLALAQLMRDAHLNYCVLNGVQDEDESLLIARAGQCHAITIATNMAGRGTDIGVQPEALALGGLHVVASQKQESQRVDRQLFGRTARQGEVGSCQMFVSADDELLQQFGPELAQRMKSMETVNGEIRLNLEADVRRVQQLAERHRFEQRLQLFQHDEWLTGVLAAVAESDQPVTGVDSSDPATCVS